MNMRTMAAALIWATALATTPASAADLSIALGADVTSMDPHFHNLTPNNNVGNHIFETLVAKDPRGRLQPALAESWRAVDELTWELNDLHVVYKPMVKFNSAGSLTIVTAEGRRFLEGVERRQEAAQPRL